MCICVGWSRQERMSKWTGMRVTLAEKRAESIMPCNLARSYASHGYPSLDDRRKWFLHRHEMLANYFVFWKKLIFYTRYSHIKPRLRIIFSIFYLIWIEYFSLPFFPLVILLLFQTQTREIVYPCNFIDFRCKCKFKIYKLEKYCIIINVPREHLFLITSWFELGYFYANGR